MSLGRAVEKPGDYREHPRSEAQQLLSSAAQQLFAGTLRSTMPVQQAPREKVAAMAKRTVRSFIDANLCKAHATRQVRTLATAAEYNKRRSKKRGRTDGCARCAFWEGHVRAFEFSGGVPTRIVYDNTRVGTHRFVGLSCLSPAIASAMPLPTPPRIFAEPR